MDTMFQLLSLLKTLSNKQKFEHITNFKSSEPYRLQNLVLNKIWSLNLDYF